MVNNVQPRTLKIYVFCLSIHRVSSRFPPANSWLNFHFSRWTFDKSGTFFNRLPAPEGRSQLQNATCDFCNNFFICQNFKRVCYNHKMYENSRGVREYDLYVWYKNKENQSKPRDWRSRQKLMSDPIILIILIIMYYWLQNICILFILIYERCIIIYFVAITCCER